MVEVGDYVKLIEGAIFNAPPEYLYGQVDEVLKNGIQITYVKVILSDDMGEMTIPRYRATKITEDEYNNRFGLNLQGEEVTKKDPKDCKNHLWVEAGQSPITGEIWYDCKFCGTFKDKIEWYEQKKELEKGRKNEK